MKIKKPLLILFTVLLTLNAVLTACSLIPASASRPAPATAATIETTLPPVETTISTAATPQTETSADNSIETSANRFGTDGITYINTAYGFTFDLPASWTDYAIVEEQWTGYAIGGEKDGQQTQSGPQLLIRHPDWTKGVPRQDIPIMVFTLDQWDQISAEELSVSAAPIPPSELGHNSEYVFALPARYNFAYLSGFEEVEQILQAGSLATFDVVLD